MARGTNKFEIKSAPYTSPKPKEVVVRARAVAINPLDSFVQAMGSLIFTWINYPFICGADVAGEVVEIGSQVKRFKVGNRVTGHAVGASKSSSTPTESAFQHYVVLREHLASPIPDDLTFEKATVLPLGLSTAACGLYMKDYLALQYPTSPAAKPNGETLLVWGGSTSVGSNAIQLAVASGYEVFTTASPRNFEYVKSLGASKAFDYNSPSVIEDITAALKGKTIAGTYSIGHGAVEKCLEIVSKCEGNKFIAMANQPGSPTSAPKGVSGFAGMAFNYLSAQAAFAFRAKAKRVKTKFVFGSDLMENEVGPMVWVDFLPKALAAGQYARAPEPLVAGSGLESIQDALNMQAKGVSAKKVVVSL